MATNSEVCLVLDLLVEDGSETLVTVGRTLADHPADMQLREAMDQTVTHLHHAVVARDGICRSRRGGRRRAT